LFCDVLEAALFVEPTLLQFVCGGGMENDEGVVDMLLGGGGSVKDD
jgi:hypothetical protein